MARYTGDEEVPTMENEPKKSVEPKVVQVPVILSKEDIYRLVIENNQLLREILSKSN